MKNKAQVVMLPTEDNSPIAIIGDSKTPSYLDDMYKRTSFSITQHIYITVSQDVEPIKVGDLFIVGDSTTIHKCVGFNSTNDLESDNHLCYTNEACRKIIATTDPKLLKYVGENYNCKIYNCQITRIEGKNYQKIPQLQQSFLEEFIANSNGEWEVEYDEWWGTDMEVKEDYPKLKLNQDNTVNITSVEEKMYSKDELTDAFNSAREFNSQDGVVDIHIIADLPKDLSPKYSTIEDWIKENL